MIKFDRYIGIDAGKGGAIATIGFRGKAQTVNMPQSVEYLEAYLRYLKSISECPIACMEKVGLWRDDLNQGKAFGIEKLTTNMNEISTVLKIVKIPFIQVFPVQWQSYLNVRSRRGEAYDDRKRRFKSVAQAHFPYLKVTLSNSDALLILEFIAFKNQREPEWIAHRLPASILPTLNLE